MKIIKDEFNSKTFMQCMGNIVDVDHKTDINEIIDAAVQDGYKHLSVKLDTKDLSVVNGFIHNGFNIVDTLISYRFDYEKTDISEYHYSEEIKIEPVKENEVEIIAKIANNSFFNDRFHNDTSLDDDLCNLYYENWIRNSCYGFADLVLVCKDKNDQILGFGTGKYIDDNESRLVLNAVTKAARGKGVYTALIWEAMKYFKGKSNYLTLGTQINNYAVQKAWIKLGFKVYDSKYVLQKKL